MESVKEVIKNSEDKMAKCEEHMHNQFAGLRTGKASPALVENVMVEYYGTATRLQELASIMSPEPRLLVINAYDPSALREIEKAIGAGNLGVTPMNDGKVIRVPIPELSEERRAELVKVAKRIAEETRVAVRNLRRDSNDHAKSLNKNSKITDDEKTAVLEGIQKATDKHIENIDKSLAAKTAEIMAV